MKLTFLGATGTVTGSRYLVEHGRRRVLVDCGLFQGLKSLRLRNRAPLTVDAGSIDAVVLTHAHIDHSGFVPRLIDQGFRGRVHATTATTALCSLLLPEAGHLQEEDAKFANRHGFSRHAPALPLYTGAEGRLALEHFVSHEFGASFEPVPGLQVHFNPAGHILGAASAMVRSEAASILFSGDLGRGDDLLMPPPAPPEAADIVLVEATYGNQLHAGVDVLTEVAAVINRTAARGGVVVVPAFAVGRAQALLHAIRLLKNARRIPDLPVYIDSPLAQDLTALYSKHSSLHRLNADECAGLYRDVRCVVTQAQSRSLDALGHPAVIVSACGMATGGRVVHHLKTFAPDARNSIVLAGYQAMGTRGAAMAAGEKQIRIHAEWVPVRAEVACIEGLSAHADRDELVAWLDAMPARPRHVYVVHGEPVAADSLRQAISHRSGWRCSVPEYGESIDLSGD
jgi:metallo-beta-lactamase family protein